MTLLSSFSDKFLEAGIDEAGRGCLAGPVVAAYVILPTNYHNPLLNDSKKLNKSTREKLRIDIQTNAICYSIGTASVDEIDKINILNSTFLAMHRAIEQAKVKAQLLLIDGNRFKPFPKINHQCIIKGDSMYNTIAAASILAKTYRDDIMTQLSLEYPYYCWDKNAAYATEKHYMAIRKYGICEHHRKTFTLFKNEL